MLEYHLPSCQCDTYVDYTQICDITCQATTEPTIGFELTSNGTISITITDPTTGLPTSYVSYMLQNVDMLLFQTV